MSYYTSADNYADLMALTGRGFALYDPEPRTYENPNDANGPPLVAPRVDIGDVGYITRNGTFSQLFNVHLPANDPLQIRGVPAGFVPLVRDDVNIEHRTRYLSSPRVIRHRQAGSTFEGVSLPGSVNTSQSWTFDNESGGASVVINDQHESLDAQNLLAYSDYFRANYRSWLDFLKFKGILKRLSDLILVTGCERTRAWAISYRESKDVVGKVSLEANVPAVGAEISLTGRMQWKSEHSVPGNCGPIYDPRSSSTKDTLAKLFDGNPVIPSQSKSRLHLSPEQETVVKGLPADQCIFIRGFQGRQLGPVDDSEPEDDEDREYTVEPILGMPPEPRDSLLSFTLEVVAEHYTPVFDDDVLIMHHEDLLPYLPDPEDTDFALWDCAENARSCLKRSLCEQAPERLAKIDTIWKERAESDAW